MNYSRVPLFLGMPHLALHQQILHTTSTAIETSALLFYDTAILLQQLITDELDNLLSVVVLAHNGNIFEDKEASKKYLQGILSIHKDNKRKYSHICSRSKDGNEQVPQKCRLCKENEEDSRYCFKSGGKQQPECSPDLSKERL